MFHRGLQCNLILETLNGSPHHRDMIVTGLTPVASGPKRDANVQECSHTSHDVGMSAWPFQRFLKPSNPLATVVTVDRGAELDRETIRLKPLM